MRGASRTLAATIALAALPSLAQTPKPAWPGADTWARAALWDDGQAEIATYEARRSAFGAQRPYETTFITVKETFTTDTWTKAESEPPAAKAIEVLKQNQVENWIADNYPCHATTTVAVDRADASRLLKLTMGHHEWCGSTFKEWRGWMKPPELMSSSYWEGEGAASRRVEPGGDGPLLLVDQLPLALRSLPFAAGFEARVRLVPSLVSSRVGDPRAVAGAIRVAGKERVECAAGAFDCWRVAVTWEDGGAATYFFAADAPHALVRYELPEKSGSLAKLRRWAYWDSSTPDPAAAKR